MEDNNSGNNLNNNEELNFEEVPTLAEMKQKKFEETGGDPLHERQGRPVNNNQNSDYNDLRYIHKRKIKNNNEDYNYDMNNIQNNNSNNNKSSTKKTVLIVVLIVVLLALIAGGIRYLIIAKILDGQNKIIKRTDEIIRNTIPNLEEGEDIYSTAKNTIEGANLSSELADHYNAEFAIYDGKSSIRGMNIVMLLNSVKNHNRNGKDSEQISISIDADTADGTNYTGTTTSDEDIDFIISNLIDIKSNNYSVKCNYDNKGYVYEIEIVEK